MNLESTAPEPSNQPASEISLADPQGVDSASEKQAFWSDQDQDHDDGGAAKARTLMLNGYPIPEAEFPHLSTIERKLKYVQGVSQSGQVHLITNLLQDISQMLLQSQNVWTIGRNRGAALCLGDRKLSRRHAVILYDAEQGFYLIDLNSMNGSYVNGDRVQQRHHLKDGDRVCLGSIEFFFFMSQQRHSLEPIHPEVISRLHNLKSRSTSFVDYSEQQQKPKI
ncbi:MAG: FHA domain-containing protein [Phormidesmis sp. CAN_BIN44]|nr:FHA domain-containing protein [Phormidesmis sp. CAN_BIN44]